MLRDGALGALFFVFFIEHARNPRLQRLLLPHSLVQLLACLGECVLQRFLKRNCSIERTGTNLLVLEGLDFGQNMRNRRVLAASRGRLLVSGALSQLVPQRLHQLAELEDQTLTRVQLVLEFCLLKSSSTNVDCLPNDPP